MFEVRNLSFFYQLGAQRLDVLKSLNFKVKEGDFVAIQGPSGSGKSTLFYILGFMLKPSAGTVIFDDVDINNLNVDELTLVRNKKIGFVFQQFHLLSRANVLENILLPSRYPSETATPSAAHMKKALGLAERLGLSEHLHHQPNQLSGGQQQRVAIARALMNDVDVILADEPTGNLDSKTSSQILDLLLALNAEGKTIIMITHDPEVAKRCAKVYHLRDGALISTEENFQTKYTAPPKSPTPIANTMSKWHQRLSFDDAMRMVKSLLPLVVDNLVRNRAKSILTMLGVIIGIAAVLSMVTLGQFTKKRILETYETLGVNKLMIQGYPNWKMKATDKVAVNFLGFDWDRDVQPLRRIFPEIREMSPSFSRWSLRAVAGGIEVGDGKVTAFGVNRQYLDINNRKILYGRNFSEANIDSHSPVCLIGYEIASRLYAHVDPLNQILNLTDGSRVNYPCKVIGVLDNVKTNKDWDPPNLNVIMPYTYFQSVADQWWYALMHTVVAQIRPDADVELAGKKIKAFFELKYGKSGQFTMGSDSTLIAQMKKFLNIFAALLASIALLSLVVGGIGINNMMLVSVSERIKEFGIRKALGATNRSLRYQVLLESLLLCIAAGVIGLILGFVSYQLLIFAATKFVPQLKYEWIFDPIAAALSMTAIVAVGVFSGLVPAVRAEKLQVIEALRTE